MVSEVVCFGAVAAPPTSARAATIAASAAAVSFVTSLLLGVSLTSAAM
jgi:hypothetical protein